MLTNIQQNFFKRMKTFGRPEQLYIVPTFDGIKLLLLNVTLMIIGLVYANNYVLLFNFILFCLFLGSMYYTHFNLQGLRLVSAKLKPFHAGENGILALQFKSTSALGHFFLGLRLENQLVVLQNKTFNFSLNPDAHKSLKVEIPVKGIQRGDIILNRLCVETLFPFHLFRCFVYFKPLLRLTIYPEKKDLQIHHSEFAYREKRDEGDDFLLTDFKLGDPLKRIHWKKLAQTNRWYSKSIITPDATPVILSLNRELLSLLNIEEQLSSLCFALYQLHFKNIKYGLALGNVTIAPDHSVYHLNHCLQVLAEYEI